MNFLKNSVYFLFLLFLHIELIFVFSMSFYALYFLNLAAVIYILRGKLSNISLIVFFLYVVVVLFIVNLEIYNNLVFELCLWLNILEKVPYISSEIMYALCIIHILIFMNLKQFEIFWAIIDKKLFGK
jgi:hypothetical protein